MFIKKAGAALMALVLTVGLATASFAAGSPSHRGGSSGGGGSSSGGGGGRSTSAKTRSSASGIDVSGMIAVGAGSDTTGANGGTWYYSPSTGGWKFIFNNGEGATGWNQLVWIDENGNKSEVFYNFDSQGWMTGSGSSASTTPSGGTWHGGHWEYVDSNGMWRFPLDNGGFATGWNELSWTANGVTSKDWYYFDQDGWMEFGIQQISGNTYLLNPEHDGFWGRMLTGTQNVNGTAMNFANSGELLN